MSDLERLLEFVACPKCHGKLKLSGKTALLCENCRLRFRVENGIAILLFEKAETQVRTAGGET